MTKEIPFTTLFEARTRNLKYKDSFIQKYIQSDRVGILVVDSVGTILSANRSAGNILQRPINSIIGGIFQHPFEVEKEPFTEKIHLPTESNSIIEVSTTSIVLDGRDLNLISLLDITDLNQVEEALHNSEDRLNLAIDAAGLGFWDYDYENNVTTVNSNYASMLGFEIEEFIDPGMWVRLVHPQDIDGLWEIWNKHIDDHSVEYYVEYRLQTKNGEWKWVLAQGQAKGKTKSGGPQHFIGTHQDITSQKLADQELNLLYHISSISSEFTSFEVKMQDILEKIINVTNIPAGSIHIFEEENQEYELISHHGISGEDSITHSATLKDLISKTVSLNQLQVSGPSFVNTQESHSSEGMIATVPIHIHEKVIGVLTGFWFKAQPITNLDLHLLSFAADQLGNAIEREKLRSAAENAVLIEERQRVARELHDSLSQSLFSLALMADGGMDYAKLGEKEKVEQIFSQIGEQVLQSLKEMRLLVYELRPVTLDQKGLIGALKSRLEMVEKRALMETSLHVESGLLFSPKVETGLYGIAQEVLNNVLKHSGAKRVEVNIGREKDSIVMSIKDNGQGFDALSETGVGLQSIRERAERLNGTVSLTSALGKGTMVKIAIPQNENKIDDIEQ